MTANDAGDDLRGGRTAGRDEKDGPNGARLEEDAEDDTAVGGVNGYEAERARRIAANKARMRALGLGAGIRIDGGDMEYDGVGTNRIFFSVPHGQVLPPTLLPRPYKNCKKYEIIRSTAAAANFTFRHLNRRL